MTWILLTAVISLIFLTSSDKEIRSMMICLAILAAGLIWLGGFLFGYWEVPSFFQWFSKMLVETRTALFRWVSGKP